MTLLLFSTYIWWLNLYHMHLRNGVHSCGDSPPQKTTSVLSATQPCYKELTKFLIEAERWLVCDWLACCCMTFLLEKVSSPWFPTHKAWNNHHTKHLINSLKVSLILCTHVSLMILFILVKSSRRASNWNNRWKSWVGLELLLAYYCYIFWGAADVVERQRAHSLCHNLKLPKDRNYAWVSLERMCIAYLVVWEYPRKSAVD